jgi:predicted phage terminase large subunit-like protein
MYQQRPIPEEGNVIPLDWIKTYDVPPDKFDRMIQSWDAAFKDVSTSSYVVGQVWGKKGSGFYLIDQVRDRMDFVRTLAAIRALSEKHPLARGKLIEDKANGPAIISTLKGEVPGIIPVLPHGSKEARLQAMAPLFQAGNVFVPTARRAPWVSEWIDEVTNFPGADHDDQVDACSQALDHLSTRAGSMEMTHVPGGRWADAGERRLP